MTRTQKPRAGAKYPEGKESLPDGEVSAEPKPNSPEDLGYVKEKRGRRRTLKPDEAREVQRLAELIAEDEGDIERALEARAAASEPLKAARASLKTHLTQLRAVVSGTWQPGMFAEDGEGE